MIYILNHKFFFGSMILLLSSFLIEDTPFSLLYILSYFLLFVILADIGIYSNFLNKKKIKRA